jgi:hypothetical protein
MGPRLTQAAIVLAVVVASGLGAGLVLAVVIASGQASFAPRIGAPASPWQRYPHNPIIVPGFAVRPRGPVGVHMTDASVLYDDEDQRWKMWFATGWTEGATPRTGIKYAESRDGIAWTLDPGLALEPGPARAAWDYTNTDTPSVIKDPLARPDRRYMLWYAGGNSTRRTIGRGFPYYQIGLAFSRDGRRFTRVPAAESPYAWAGLVLVVQHAFPALPQVKDGVLTDPEVVRRGGIYHMWFSGLAQNDRGMTVTKGIGHATSRNGVSWKASRKNPLPSLMREHPIAPSSQPSVIWNPRKAAFEMWYTNDRDEELKRFASETREFAASGYWYASSTNGVDWTTLHGRGRDFRWDRRNAAEHYGLITGAEVVWRRGEYRMYYNALGTSRAARSWPQPVIWAMNLATRK